MEIRQVSTLLPNLTFDQLVEILLDERDYKRGLEARIKRLERERDGWRDIADPGWRRREIEAALDGEIRLLREQG